MGRRGVEGEGRGRVRSKGFRVRGVLREEAEINKGLDHLSSPLFPRMRIGGFLAPPSFIFLRRSICGTTVLRSTLVSNSKVFSLSFDAHCFSLVIIQCGITGFLSVTRDMIFYKQSEVVECHESTTGTHKSCLRPVKSS
jgi:hypothetical protein